MDTNPEHQGLSADEIALLSSGELDETGTPVEDDQDRQRAAAVAAANESRTTEDTSDDVDTEVDPAKAGQASPAATPAASTTPAVEEGAAPAAPAAEVQAEAAPQQPAPATRYDVPDAAKITEQLAEVDQKQAEAFKKLMDGETTQEDYEKTSRELRAQERSLVAKQTLHEANEQNEAAIQRAVYENIGKLGETVGVKYATDVKAQAQFDACMNIELNDPANQGKTFAEVANLAHQAVLGMRGITKAPATATATATATAPATPPAIPVARSVDKSLLPPTLSRVPPAADPSIAGDEFAHMAGLNGVDLEKAYARMTPEQQERYLN